jgi:hypothetical protein
MKLDTCLAALHPQLANYAPYAGMSRDEERKHRLRVAREWARKVARKRKSKQLSTFRIPCPWCASMQRFAGASLCFGCGAPAPSFELEMREGIRLRRSVCGTEIERDTARCLVEPRVPANDTVAEPVAINNLVT